jgi:CCR4-NOT complex subunit CAF16
MSKGVMDIMVIIVVFQVYIAHGKLQLALPLEKVKEMSQLSLMVSGIHPYETVSFSTAWSFIRFAFAFQRTVESWLRKERDERRKERKQRGLPEFDKVVEGSRVIGDPAKSAARVINNGWAAGRLTSTIAGEENFVFSSNSVLRQ